MRLTGTVTDANGAPLGGVAVTIDASRMEGGVIGGLIGGSMTTRPKPELKNDATTVTDANGRYMLEGLVPREESVYFSHPGHAATTRTVMLEGREAKLDVQLSSPAS